MFDARATRQLVDLQEEWHGVIPLNVRVIRLDVLEPHDVRLQGRGLILAGTDATMTEILAMLVQRTGWSNSPERIAQGIMMEESSVTGQFSDWLTRKQLGLPPRLAKRLELVLKGDYPGHPFRGNQWTGGRGGVAGSSLDHPIRARSVAQAIRLVSEGKFVAFKEPRQLSVMLDRLAKMSRDAQPGKVYDLCKVTIPGTSLFCGQHKGFSRLEMPQLKAKPLPGSKADKMPKNDKGEVDLAGEFVKFLRSKGVKIEEGVRERADFLKATQNELNGTKVAGMSKAMREGKIKEEPIIVNDAGYVLDGHHRWAATVGVEYATGKTITMPVTRVHMDATMLVKMANDFCTDMGIPRAAV